ncbi:hypothetical protein DICPUDRAFT_153664 [Dictyostelium purpureum]|uniref:Uncharacterized protein n=1 Tax=Dictyostelium purpureum TaxID=5786 RepID=F0ZPG3_DICPU|nr:uncharacterized protein DICPUDRAFT_153664 [Dictyostelium purpureum]EGC34164.1 hypothetical protein DICPUDRAFT_153664 [Dictyostelium purpureum]|eukprot:XP_003289318.1 hypothetical protein DICPUDRAFT_153664 [Dictyostelium purpureum]
MFSWGSGRIGFGSFSDVKEPKQLYFNRSNDGSDGDTYDENDCKNDIDFIDFSAGRRHSLAVDNSNKVWVFGDIGDNVTEFRKYPILDKSLENENIKQVSCWDRNYAINDKGQVIQWGSNDGTFLIPRVIPFNYSIKQVSCSLNNTMAVSSDGIAFVNIFQAEASKFKVVQYFIENKIQVIQVACGVKHCLFLDSKGLVYSSGKGIQTGQYASFGEIDDGGEGTVPQDSEEDLSNLVDDGTIKYDFDQPKQVKELCNIIEIKAGYKHSLALDYYTQQTYAWGENLNGQLGMEGVDYVFEPTIIPFPLVQIKTIEAGAYHSAFITTKGQLIMVGGVLIVNSAFRMNLALGNGEGGLNTIQFKVNVEEEETVITENIVIPKPVSTLINVKEKEQHEKEQKLIPKEDQDLDDDGVILSKEEILEFQYHLNEIFHSDYSRSQYNPQFIQSTFKNKVVDKVSCGLFHTLATLKKDQVQPINSLQEYCIKYISDNILTSMESDSSFQDIYNIPLDIVLKIDSYLTLERKHNDKSLRLMFFLKSSYNNKNKINNNNDNTIQNQWDEYLTSFSDFESVVIASLSDYSVITKSPNIEISKELIKEFCNQESQEMFLNNQIKIPSYQESFTIICIENKILALNKQYTLIIDKTNLLLVMAIFKRELLTNSYILKDFDNNILNLKINGY